MAIFDTTLDGFAGTGALSANWSAVPDYTIMERLNNEAIATTSKSGAAWTVLSGADGNVWLEIGTVIPWVTVAVVYRYAGGDGYVLRVIADAGNMKAILYLFSDPGTPLAPEVIVKAAAVQLDTGDAVGVAFSGDQHQIWYKPSGGAAALVGTITDASILTGGAIGMLNGASA